MEPLTTTTSAPPRYTQSQAYADLHAAVTAISRQCKVSGNRKMQRHLDVLESFCAVATKVLDQTDPAVVRSIVTTFEIKERLDALDAAAR